MSLIRDAKDNEKFGILDRISRSALNAWGHHNVNYTAAANFVYHHKAEQKGMFAWYNVINPAKLVQFLSDVTLYELPDTLLMIGHKDETKVHNVRVGARIFVNALLSIPRFAIEAITAPIRTLYKPTKYQWSRMLGEKKSTFIGKALGVLNSLGPYGIAAAVVGAFFGLPLSAVIGIISLLTTMELIPLYANTVNGFNLRLGDDVTKYSPDELGTENDQGEGANTYIDKANELQQRQQQGLSYQTIIADQGGAGKVEKAFDAPAKTDTQRARKLVKSYLDTHLDDEENNEDRLFGGYQAV